MGLEIWFYGHFFNHFPCLCKKLAIPKARAFGATKVS
jgi:hypothetical protein